jgi:hypothetical protein
MAVQVYVWFPKLKEGNIGHAAMQVDGGDPPGSVYLSRWPGSYSAVLAGSGTNQSYTDDVSAEGGAPSVVRLTKLNESAIKYTIRVACTVNLYSFLVLNCATQVGMCLNAGIPLSAIAIAAINTPPNTPWNLYLYAQLLRPLYA